MLFELPELENAEFIDESEVDPHLLCSEEYASRSGIIGPFGLLALASEDQTEHTAIFFRIYRAPNRFVCLMCSDQTRLFLIFSLFVNYGAYILWLRLELFVYTSQVFIAAEP